MSVMTELLMGLVIAGGYLDMADNENFPKRQLMRCSKTTMRAVAKAIREQIKWYQERGAEVSFKPRRFRVI